MRFATTIVTIVALMLLSACTALMVGGSTTNGQQSSGDTRQASVIAADASITAAIRDKFAADSTLMKFGIGVRTWNGTVTLTGSVDGYIARDHAGRLAKSTTGVTAVNNQVVVNN